MKGRRVFSFEKYVRRVWPGVLGSVVLTFKNNYGDTDQMMQGALYPWYRLWTVVGVKSCDNFQSSVYPVNFP